MNEHEKLVEKAKKALNEVFKDDSVPMKTTFESLKDLRDEIDILLGATEIH